VPDNRSGPPSKAALFFRLAWTVVSIVVVQTIVCGLAMVPAVALWAFVASLPVSILTRLLLFSGIAIPSTVAFAVTLLIVSPIATWVTRTRTPANLELRIADMSWPLMTWARYMVAIHIVRVFAGTLFRGSPFWTAYLRLNGARLGRGVYINTLHISDHNLLDFGDQVIIGSEVHVSGHTVESGVVKTGNVRLGDQVTVGLGTTIEIGVVAGDRCQIGALSFVPKHTALDAGAVYVGSPVRRI
jgi:serine acetyltransferase